MRKIQVFPSSLGDIVKVHKLMEKQEKLNFDVKCGNCTIDGKSLLSTVSVLCRADAVIKIIGESEDIDIFLNELKKEEITYEDLLSIETVW